MSAGAERLSGAPAFEALRERLAGGAVPGAAAFAEPAFARLAAAVDLLTTANSARPTALDLAVLVRQALRYQELSTGAQDGVTLRVPADPSWPSLADWGRVGVVAGPAAGGYLVRARAWRPAWLPDAGEAGVDGPVVAETPRRPDKRVPADPFVTATGRSYYTSSGQRDGVRAALTAPPGSTLVIDLPTGDGKSFVFHMVSQMGYDGMNQGVTLVVVPTTALALDQERAAYEMGFTGYRLAYRGGQGAGENKEMLDAIASGAQRLCFASPEAACGPLYEPLLKAARTGLLNALVVDEAHLVETWGADFRSEFQMLGGVRQAILREAGGSAPRTLLLSATLTEQSISALRSHFGKDAEGKERFAVYAAASLRPEIEYWIAPEMTEPLREERVLEALLHVPRPAILYVTRVEDAQSWSAALRQTGFGRVACVTGRTPSNERQAAVDGWKAGTLDLVVGTSAFGIGIDNPHVRSVIHACVPETLDRFYQEVGRGGRDGCASLSLVLHTARDQTIAGNLNAKKVITRERGLERWQAMYQSRLYDPKTDTHRIRLDVAPGTDAEQIDMVGARNTEWHVRTLTMMASAGIISLLGSEVDEERHPCERVRILEQNHLKAAVWEEKFEGQRRTLLRANFENLRAMIALLQGKGSVSSLLKPVYEVPHLQVGDREVSVLLDVPTPYPWAGEPVTRGPGQHLLDEWGRAVIFYPNPPGGLSATERRRMTEGLATLMRDSRIHNLIVPPGGPVDPEALQKRCPGWPVFRSDRILLHGLPPGPTVVVVPPGEKVTASLLATCPPEVARFLFLPEEIMDPELPGVPLKQRHRGRQLSLREFLRQVEL